MATINGARAMGWELRIGSLEVGKQADVVSILLRNTPVFDVFSSLVYVARERVFACVSFLCALLLLLSYPHIISVRQLCWHEFSDGCVGGGATAAERRQTCGCG